MKQILAFALLLLLPLGANAQTMQFNYPAIVSGTSGGGSGGGTGNISGTLTSGFNVYATGTNTVATDNSIADNGAGQLSLVRISATAVSGTTAQFGTSTSIAGALVASGAAGTASGGLTIANGGSTAMQVYTGSSGNAPIFRTGTANAYYAFTTSSNVGYMIMGGTNTNPAVGIGLGFQSGSVYTTPSATLHVSGTVAFTNIGTGAGTGAACFTSPTGALTYSGTACTVSSGIFKENIMNLTNGLALVEALQPVTFDYKTQYKVYGEGPQIGLIAEDVDQVIPAIVGHFTLPDGTPYSNIDYARIVAPLVGAVKELKAKNDALEARVHTLEQKVGL